MSSRTEGVAGGLQEAPEGEGELREGQGRGRGETDAQAGGGWGRGEIREVRRWERYRRSGRCRLPGGLRGRHSEIVSYRLRADKSLT